MILADESIAVVSLNATLVTALVSLVIPVLVGLATNARTSSTVKGALSIVLNAINALIVTHTVADGSAWVSKQATLAWIVGTLTSLAIYLHIYKPAGITSTPNKQGVALLNGTTPHQP